MSKRPYPRNDDVREAIIAVLSSNPLIHPADFPERVFEMLEERGFYTGHLTVKRIWRLYEEMVRNGKIIDVLGVVVEK